MTPRRSQKPFFSKYYSLNEYMGELMVGTAARQFPTKKSRAASKARAANKAARKAARTASVSVVSVDVPGSSEPTASWYDDASSLQGDI